MFRSGLRQAEEEISIRVNILRKFYLIIHKVGHLDLLSTFNGSCMILNRHLFCLSKSHSILFHIKHGVVLADKYIAQNP